MEIDDRVLEIGTRVKYVAKDEFERKAATIVNVDTSGMANGEPPEYTIRLDIGGTERSTFREYLTIDTKNEDDNLMVPASAASADSSAGPPTKRPRSTTGSAGGAQIVECFYSLSSPWMYLGGPQLQDIVRRHRVKLVLKPFDFQDVGPQNGGIPLLTRPEARKTYHAEELARWSDFLGMPLNPNPAHYKPNLPGHMDKCWNKYAGWMVIAAQSLGEDAFVLSHALLRALWAEERDITEPAVRIQIANENGYDGSKFHAMEQSPEVQQLYKLYTQDAKVKGVFGAPTFLVDGERFWGQDRLSFLDRKLGQLKRS